jgi:arsenite methyltransferase
MDQAEERMDDVKEAVRARYRAAALHVLQSDDRATCSPASTGCCDPVSGNLYQSAETEWLPKEALQASLGCGNPTALADLQAGDVVLDLGSGGGIDVLLSARRVAPGGKAYGVDMTDAMLELARENQRKAGVTNVEFLKGDIEHIPLPDASVDVIISNCVINLSADKPAVLREAFRVLKPGGRFAVSDVVVCGDIPDVVRHSMELWVGCIAGALEENEFRRLLLATGFHDVDIEPTRVYEFEEARAVLSAAGLDADALAREVGGRIKGAFVRARKP